MNTKYAVVDNGENIQLKNGMYKISDGSKDLYYAFDNKGKMMTGFITVEEGAKSYTINIQSGQIEASGTIEAGKYYLMENGEYKGALWNQSITINNVTYVIAGSGKIIEEILNITDNTGTWLFDSTMNRWKYVKKNEDNTTSALTAGVYAIPNYNGIYYYIFDNNGYMMTGLVEFEGKTYYLQEEGVLTGAVFTGELIVGDEIYTFDSSTGELIDKKNLAHQIIPIL
ncbi:MAG: hypothetical protein IKI71_04465 [Lachnospiraceae bacterium]|nr:hypothetical protein [Lachnospiraceae bacterium]